MGWVDHPVVELTEDISGQNVQAVTSHASSTHPRDAKKLSEQHQRMLLLRNEPGETPK